MGEAVYNLYCNISIYILYFLVFFFFKKFCYPILYFVYWIFYQSTSFWFWCFLLCTIIILFIIYDSYEAVRFAPTLSMEADEGSLNSCINTIFERKGEKNYLESAVIAIQKQKK